MYHAVPYWSLQPGHQSCWQSSPQRERWSQEESWSPGHRRPWVNQSSFHFVTTFQQRKQIQNSVLYLYVSAVQMIRSISRIANIQLSYTSQSSKLRIPPYSSHIHPCSWSVHGLIFETATPNEAVSGCASPEKSVRDRSSSNRDGSKLYSTPKIGWSLDGFSIL